MSKRHTWFVILLVIITAAAITYFFRDQLFKKYDLIDAVPESTALFFQLNEPARQLESFRSDSVWRSLQNYALITQLESDLALVDSVFDTEADDNLLQGTRLISAIEKTGALQFSVLHILTATAGDFKPVVAASPDDRKYQGEKIITYKFGEQRLKVFRKKNLLICSTSDYLLEKSIDQLQQDYSLSQSPEFAKARLLSDKNDLPKCFIQLSALPSLFSVTLNNEATNTAKQLMQNLGKWAMLDITSLGSDLFVSGYLVSADETNLLGKIQQNGSIRSDITDVLPFNTALFYSINSHSFSQLVRATDQSSNAVPIFDEYIQSWLGSQAGIGIVEPFSANISSNTFLVAKAADTFLASKRMQELAARNIPETSVAPQLYKGLKIYQINDFDHLDACFGFNSTLLKDPFFVLLDDYVVFANSISDLKVLIERYLDQQTLDKDLDFLAFEEQMSSNASLTLFVNTSRAYQLLNNIANDAFSKYLKADFKDFRQLNPVGIQFSNYRDNTYLINGFIQSYSAFQQSSNLVWKAELDTTPAYAPIVVKNHDDGSNEIVTQDAFHNFYLIDEGGQILWKKKLDGPIVGKIHQVDFYRNGKLQYLFSTSRSIHLIDRLGRNVENFPLKLPSPITSGLSIFDYNRNGKYRMFLACENKNIYGFYKSGKPLPGWSPNEMKAVIPHEIKHFISDTRDYIMTLDKNGKLSLLNRQGDDRMGPFELETSFMQPFYLEKLGNDDFRLVNCDERGIIYTITNGKTVSTDSLANTYGKAVFRYHDITGDGKPEYILKDAFKLLAYNQNKEKLFEYSLPDALEEDLFFAKLKDKEPMIGMYSRAEEMIYLVKASGSLYKQFPLPGNTPFSIAQLMTDDEWLVITGMKDRTITTYRVK